MTEKSDCIPCMHVGGITSKLGRSVQPWACKYHLQRHTQTWRIIQLHQKQNYDHKTVKNVKSPMFEHGSHGSRMNGWWTLMNSWMSWWWPGRKQLPSSTAPTCDTKGQILLWYSPLLYTRRWADQSFSKKKMLYSKVVDTVRSRNIGWDTMCWRFVLFHARVHIMQVLASCVFIRSTAIGSTFDIYWEQILSGTSELLWLASKPKQLIQDSVPKPKKPQSLK